MSSTINVGDQEFALAVGGYAPKGGACGKGGEAYHYNGDVSGTIDYDDPYSTGKSITPANSVAGNVNGGGVGYYGKMTKELTAKAYGAALSESAVANVFNENAPGALIIIAKGNVIINSQILASACDGVVAKDGTTAYDTGSGSNHYVHSGKGGDGAVPPSGGGAVTIICNAITINSKIDTNGKKFISPDGGNNNTQHVYSTDIYAMGGYGGKGGTFISTAGEIKVYTGVSE